MEANRSKNMNRRSGASQRRLGRVKSEERTLWEEEEESVVVLERLDAASARRCFSVEPQARFFPS
jgi:hypothetical protein